MNEELNKSSIETQEVHQQALGAKQALTQSILDATTPLGGVSYNEPILPKGFIKVGIFGVAHFIAVSSIVSITETQGDITILSCSESVGKQGTLVYIDESHTELLARIIAAQ